ncbi:MAG: M50 family metallopeptidase [Bacteroidetes bacterium]|nr:M50 family metallopeptidase [Bacteroidota bacterium]
MLKPEKLESSQWLKGYNLRHIAVLAAMIVVTVLLWDTVIIHPFKVFVVMTHELSHGLAAILTGGEISRIQIEPTLGGAAYTRGGSRAIILMAGYIGSMLWGALILILASRTRLDRGIAITIGLLLVWVSIRYVTNDYGQVFGLLGGVILIALGTKGPHVVIELLLQYIGLTSILYAPLDIYDDTIRRQIQTSDAEQFARIWGLNGTFWGVIWIVLAGIVALWSLRFATRKTKTKPIGTGSRLSV